VTPHTWRYGGGITVSPGDEPVAQPIFTQQSAES
jgi:hypothetical protein